MTGCYKIGKPILSKKHKINVLKWKLEMAQEETKWRAINLVIINKLQSVKQNDKDFEIGIIVTR